MFQENMSQENLQQNICSRKSAAENMFQCPSWLVSRAIPCSTAGALWQEYVENPIWKPKQNTQNFSKCSDLINRIIEL